LRRSADDERGRAEELAIELRDAHAADRGTKATNAKLAGKLATARRVLALDKRALSEMRQEVSRFRFDQK
mgnify:CR=1